MNRLAPDRPTLAALPAGARVRARVVLRQWTETTGAVRLLLLEVQAADTDRPVMSAEWMVMFLFRLPD